VKHLKRQKVQTSDRSGSVKVADILPASPMKLPLAISGVAVLLSLSFSFLLFPLIRGPLQTDVDVDRYGELVANINAGRGFVLNGSPNPAIDRGPIYPYLLAGLFRLTGGVSHSTVQIFQALCHGLTCFLIFLAAIRVFPRRVAIVTQLLCSIHPMLLWYSARMWVETVYTLVVTIVVLATILSNERLTVTRFIAVGVAVGVAVLTKPTLLLFPLFFAFYSFLRWKRKNSWQLLLLILSVFLLVVPWIFRNYSVSGDFVPVRTGLGFTLVQGDVIGEYWPEKPYSNIELWYIGMVKVDSILARTQDTVSTPSGGRKLIFSSLRHNLTHPLFFTKRIAANFVTFWYLSQSKIKSLFLVFIQLPLLVCVFLVSLRIWGKNQAIQPVILLIGYYAAVHSFLLGWARYSAPIIPACLFFVAYALVEIHRKFQRPRLLLTSLT
jgi:4-amino-4-deoxy-L-arabinose transferase-like glycosyltransferase